MKNVILTLTLYSDQVVNFVKKILSKNDSEDESSFKVIIEFVKDIQLMEHKDRLFKVLNMRCNQTFNNVMINLSLMIKQRTNIIICYQYLIYYLFVILSLRCYMILLCYPNSFLNSI